MKKIKRFFKKHYQIMIRGFSDQDLCSLDVTLATWLRPRLERFRKITITYPAHLNEVEWETTLKKIERALYLIEMQFDLDHFLTEDESKEIDEGMNLLAKYMSDLWI